MSKKKNTKKHQFKHAAPVSDAAKFEKTASAADRGGLVVSERDFGYVSHDVKRLALMATCLVALEFLLWYLMNHTGLGRSIYNIIKL